MRLGLAVGPNENRIGGRSPRWQSPVVGGTVAGSNAAVQSTTL